MSDENVAYHVTPTKNVKRILAKGLDPKIPLEGDVEGVYLFPDKITMQDALMNWLGDKFEEDEKLTSLKVDLTRVERPIESDVGYEIRVIGGIPPEAISIDQYDI